jgi:hypothetical protein
MSGTLGEPIGGIKDLLTLDSSQNTRKRRLNEKNTL